MLGMRGGVRGEGWRFLIVSWQNVPDSPPHKVLLYSYEPPFPPPLIRSQLAVNFQKSPLHTLLAMTDPLRFLLKTMWSPTPPPQLLQTTPPPTLPPPPHTTQLFLHISCTVSLLPFSLLFLSSQQYRLDQPTAINLIQKWQNLYWGP